MRLRKALVVMAGLAVAAAVDRRGPVRAQRQSPDGVDLGLPDVAAGLVFARSVAQWLRRGAVARTDARAQGAPARDSWRRARRAWAAFRCSTTAAGSQWMTVEGYKTAENETIDPYCNAVLPGYFATIGVPIIAGPRLRGARRPAGGRSPSERRRVAIVSEKLREALLQGRPRHRHAPRHGQGPGHAS